MGLVAAIVVGAASIAERSRPAVAALVATLPVSIGPTYVLLALDHDAAFLTAAALKSAASVGATMAFIMAYANALTRFGPASALAAAYCAWIPAAWFVHHHAWTVGEVVMFVALTSIAGAIAMRRLRHHQAESSGQRRRWDIPARAAGVVALVGAITALSESLGPSGSGTLANFPVVMTSVTLITHLRLGGLAAAAMLANSTGGMVGVSAALLTVHFAIPVLGAALALLTGLVFCIVWNLGIFLRAHHRF